MLWCIRLHHKWAKGGNKNTLLLAGLSGCWMSTGRVKHLRPLADVHCPAVHHPDNQAEWPTVARPPGGVTICLLLCLHYPPKDARLACLLSQAGYYFSNILNFKIKKPDPHAIFWSILCINWISVKKLHLEGSQNRSMTFIRQWRRRVDRCDFSLHYLHFPGMNGNSKTQKPIIISQNNQ